MLSSLIPNPSFTTEMLIIDGASSDIHLKYFVQKITKQQMAMAIPEGNLKDIGLVSNTLKSQDFVLFSSTKASLPRQPYMSLASK